MTTKFRRGAVAVAIAFGSLLLPASPASATLHDLDIQTGNNFLHSTTSLGATIPWDGTGTGCTKTASIDVTHTQTTTGTWVGTINVTTFTMVQHMVFNGNHYVVTIARTSSGSGTIATTGTSGSISSMSISFQIEVRAAANNSSTNFDCVPTGTVLCRLRWTSHYAGTYTHDNPLATSLSGSDVMTVTTTTPASITLGIGTCQVPFATLNGGSATSFFTAHLAT